MEKAYRAVDEALNEVARARNRFVSKRATQITAADDLDYLKSVAFSWFQSHRLPIAPIVGDQALRETDAAYRKVLDATARASARTTYVDAFRAAKETLAAVRSAIVTANALPAPGGEDAPPDFSLLAADSLMQRILQRRWLECQRCIGAAAPLAATVMMGGLLEALFVGYANRLTDKRPLFSQKSTPKDPKTKKPIPLTEWTLRPYIDVGHELGWITKSGKDVAAVLRDYRNYVHPEKERSHGVELSDPDARMFWAVTKQLTDQLLSTVTKRAG